MLEELCHRQTSPSAAFEITRGPDMRVRKGWDQVKVDVMREALLVKSSQNPELGKDQGDWRC